MKNLNTIYQDFCIQLNTYNEAYYSKNSPTIADAEYDKLLVELRQLEKDHPELITKDSPTQKVGSSLDGYLPRVKHIAPMLSLYTETDFTEKGAYDFTRRVSNHLVSSKISEKGDRSYCCELKFDGLGVSLFYEYGIFKRALTRGDGEYGEDVTNNVFQISNIPKFLKGANDFVTQYPDQLEVRGEVMMLKSVFKTINLARAQSGEKQYANTRNAAAGVMRALDSSRVKASGLVFYTYDMVDTGQATLAHTQSAALSLMKDWGLPVFDFFTVTKEPDSLVKFHDDALANRNNLDFDIDGVVYKVDNFDLQGKLGYSGREPKWATAHKFEPEQATSVVLAIDIQVGRTGKLTPVARIAPVAVGGVIVSNATLHNEDEIKRLNVCVGSTVSLERAGDVIPKITSAVSAPGLTSFIFPNVCPVCNSPAIRPEGEVDYRCTGKSICPAQNTQALIHFCSRKAMNIQGVGDKLIEQLTDAGIVQTVSDLYSLGMRAKTSDKVSLIDIYNFYPQSKRIQLATEVLCDIDRMADQSAANIVSAIEKSKVTTLPKFLYSLGIRYAAEGTAKRLSNYFGTLEAVMAASEEQLSAVDDIGPVVSKSVYEFFNDPNNQQLIKELMHFGVTWPVIETKPEEELILKDLSFVITGSCEGVSRDELKQILEKHGAIVSDTVNAKTTTLICGDKAGSKLAKALANNVPIMQMQAVLQDHDWYRKFEKNRKT